VTHDCRRLDGPQARSRYFREKITGFLLPGIETQFLDGPIRNVVTIPTGLTRPLYLEFRRHPVTKNSVQRDTIKRTVEF